MINGSIIIDDNAIDEYESSETYILPDLGGLCGREIKLRSCSCTNAQAEIACSEFVPTEPYTHPWKRFDFIVIDEVHAVLADANYQSAPFYIQRLLEEVKIRSSRCKVIVMTGSPDIIKDYPLFEDYHLIDKMDVCDNLVPKTVTFISQKKSHAAITQHLAENKKAIGFFNRIDDIVRLAEKLSDDTAQRIAPSFSHEEKRRRLKKQHRPLFDAMERAEDFLATQSRLPDDTMLFLTNARNKEGINIKNTDLKTMFVHAHAEVDIKQMVGRVRNGLDTLYVVVDAPSFEDHDLPGELVFTKNSTLLETVNVHFEMIAKEVNYVFRDHHTVLSQPKLCEYILFVHEKFPYIRFDYFSEKFIFYTQRQLSKEYYEAQNEMFSAHLTKQGFEVLTQSWFPGAQCIMQYCIDDRKQAIVDEYIERHCLLGKRLRKQDERLIFESLSELIKEDFKKLGNLLRRYGYLKKRRGKHSTGDWTIMRL